MRGKTQESMLQSIMKKKTTSEGFVSSECWKTEGEDTVGYALITKWESKEPLGLVFI